MSRSYAADDVIALPRMSAAHAFALGTSLVAAAGKHSVPKSAAKAFRRLEDANGNLNQALLAAAADKTYGPEAVAADRVIDNAWGSLHDWLLAWKRLPDSPSAAKAGAVHAAVFPDGLAFIQKAFPEEWTQSQLRLQKIDRDGHGTAISDLGGKEILTKVKSAHKTYGSVLGITNVDEATKVSSGPAKRPHLDAFASALRDYVAKVAASAEPDDDASQQLATSLLAPLTDFKAKSAGTTAAAPATPAAAPEPAAPTAPKA